MKYFGPWILLASSLRSVIETMEPSSSSSPPRDNSDDCSIDRRVEELSASLLDGKERQEVEEEEELATAAADDKQEEDHSDDDDDDDDDDDVGSETADDDDDENEQEQADKGDDDDDDDLASKAEEESGSPKEEGARRRPPRKDVFRLDLDETVNDYNARLARRGVIYLPSVPVSMTPTILRQLLEPHGEITRLYLKPNYNNRRAGSSSTRPRRQRYGEGWVEFAKRRMAKHVVSYLHMTTITNNQRSIMCGDLWNMKYLGHKFKWEILTETIAYERRVREQRLRLETMQARREAHQYKEWLNQNETLDLIAKRQSRRRRDDGTASTSRIDDGNTVVGNNNNKNDGQYSIKRERDNKKRQRHGGEKQPLNEQGPERATKKLVLESLL